MKSVKIAMWSGPRNLSTALMRSFENRDDTFVTDEPFYAHYLNNVDDKHPMKDEIIKNNNTNWNQISRFLTGPIPSKKSVWYQKHMAHHNILNLDISWINDVNNCFLIRNPKEVILSYSRKFKLNSINQLGFTQQFNLYEVVSSNNINKILIIDAEDLVTNPKKILSEICINLNISFSDKMLSWPLGGRESDGEWAKYWYKNVVNTSSFYKYKKNNQKLPKEYMAIYNKSMKYYEYLYDRRIN
tara:strand:+ start:64 stop:792 length:729 start_codon:yes stop_codon:yes gene_type:complete